MERRVYTVAYKNGDDDIRFACREDESVFHAMLRAHGGPLHHGCCGGGCGVCKMRVADGRYHIFKRMSRAHISEAEQAAGILLLCCVQPRSDLILHKALEPMAAI